MLLVIGGFGPDWDQNNGEQGTTTVKSSENFAAKGGSAKSTKAPFAAESLGFVGAAATSPRNFAADPLQMQQTGRRRRTGGCGPL